MLTAISGIVGVAIGKISSDVWTKDKDLGDGRIKHGNQRADAYICAIGMFVSACATFGVLFTAKDYPDLTWALCLIGRFYNV